MAETCPSSFAFVLDFFLLIWEDSIPSRHEENTSTRAPREKRLPRASLGQARCRTVSDGRTAKGGSICEDSVSSRPRGNNSNTSTRAAREEVCRVRPLAKLEAERYLTGEEGEDGKNQKNLRSREQNSHALLVNVLSLPNQLRPCSLQLSSAGTTIHGRRHACCKQR